MGRYLRSPHEPNYLRQLTYAIAIRVNRNLDKTQLESVLGHDLLASFSSTTPLRVSPFGLELGVLVGDKEPRSTSRLARFGLWTPVR